MYNSATDGAAGVEFWKSDGNQSGTVQVSDINSGAASSNPLMASSVKFGASLYFAAATAVSGQELWKTNGAQAGTQLVSDLFTGVGSSSPNSFTVGNNLLYFFAADAAGQGNGRLWRTDGTGSGTALIDSTTTNATKLIRTSSNAFYYVATNVVNGTELWKYAPTSPTVSVAATAAPNPNNNGISNLSVLGADDAGEVQLTYTWSVSGTPPGTATFGATGTNAAKNTTVTLSAVGTYNLIVAVKDTDGLVVTSGVTVAITVLQRWDSASGHESVRATQKVSAGAQKGEGTG